MWDGTENYFSVLWCRIGWSPAALGCVEWCSVGSGNVGWYREVLQCDLVQNMMVPYRIVQCGLVQCRVRQCGTVQRTIAV